MSIFWRIAYPGMRVVAERDKDGYNNKDHPPEGTFGTLVRPKRYTSYRSRFGYDMHEHQQGIYEQDGAWDVQWDITLTNADGSHSEVLTGPIVGAHTYLCRVHDDCLQHYNMRYKSLWVDHVEANKYETTRQEESLLHTIHIGELPETKFWEWDLCIVSAKGQRMHSDNIGRYRRIREILYHIFADEGSEPVYNVEWVAVETGEVDRNAGTTYVRESEMELVERGNVWRHYHNEKLVFNTLAEEVELHWGLGKIHEVRNPKENNLFIWREDKDVLDAIEHGIADGFEKSPGLLACNVVGNHPIRCDDRELGERIRKQTLAAFGRAI